MCNGSLVQRFDRIEIKIPRDKCRFWIPLPEWKPLKSKYRSTDGTIGKIGNSRLLQQIEIRSTGCHQDVK